MKVFRICGKDNSGKTTTLEYIIRDMTSRGLKVCTGKDFTDKDFTIDKLGRNTMRHRIAGSKTVVARGLNETNLLVQRRMGLDEIIEHLTDYDYCALEGFDNAKLPKIITACTWAEVDEFLDENAIAISGVVANDLAISEYKGVAVFNGILAYRKLVDMLIETVQECDLSDPSLQDKVDKVLPTPPRQRKTLTQRKSTIQEKEKAKANEKAAKTPKKRKAK